MLRQGFFYERRQMKRLFYFVRHGETRFNQEKRLQGHCDSPLSQTGIEQVKQLKKVLDQRYFDAVFASTSGRVRLTTDILLKNRSLSCTYLDDLQEPSFGIAEGDYFQDHRELKNCFEQFDWSFFHGDSFEKTKERIQRVFKEILSKTKEDDRILVVSHGTMMQMVEKVLLGMDVLAYRKHCHQQGKSAIPNAGILIFSYEDGHYSLVQAPVSPYEINLEPEEKTIHFYYVRHGQTLFNQQKKVMGQSDSPLTEKGIEQARIVQRKLSRIPFRKAYSSFAKRAIDTTKIILEGRDVPISIEKDLQQLDFGDLEGQSRMKVNDEMNDCHEHGEDFRSHQGERKEDLLVRFDRLLKKMVLEAKDGDSILLVSHGTYYTILIDRYAGLNRKLLQYQQAKLGEKESYHGGIALFEWKNQQFQLKQLMKKGSDFREEK